jgi:hypothetical protein
MYATRWITDDLLEAGGISLPHDYRFVAGSTIDIAFPDGRTGRLTCTDQPPRKDGCRAHWSCRGSQHDGRAFDLTPGLHSDGFVPGQPIMVPATMVLVPK